MTQYFEKYSGPALISRSGWQFIFASVGGWVLFNTLVLGLVRELDPLQGNWQATRIFFDDGRIGEVNFWFAYVDIDGEKLKIQERWSCGAIIKTYVRGRYLVVGNRVLVTANSDEPTKSGAIERTKDGKLRYRMAHPDMGVITVEFERSHNANTVYDLLGWE